MWFTPIFDPSVENNLPEACHDETKFCGLRCFAVSFLRCTLSRFMPATHSPLDRQEESTERHEYKSVPTKWSSSGLRGRPTVAIIGQIDLKRYIIATVLYCYIAFAQQNIRSNFRYNYVFFFAHRFFSVLRLPPKIPVYQADTSRSLSSRTLLSREDRLQFIPMSQRNLWGSPVSHVRS